MRIAAVFTAWIVVLNVVGSSPTGHPPPKSLQIKVCGDFCKENGVSTFGQNFHF